MLDAQLKKKIADNIWLAEGKWSNSAGHNGTASVLVEDKGDNNAELVLYGELHKSTFNDREVIAYENEITAVAEKGFKTNCKIQFKNFSVKLFTAPKK